MNFDRRKDYFKKGNTLSFNEAREIAKAEEPAAKQLQLMNTAVEVHPVSSKKRNPNQRDQSDGPIRCSRWYEANPGIVVGVYMHVSSAQQKMQRITTVRR